MTPAPEPPPMFKRRPADLFFQSPVSPMDGFSSSSRPNAMDSLLASKSDRFGPLTNGPRQESQYGLLGKIPDQLTMLSDGGLRHISKKNPTPSDQLSKFAFGCTSTEISKVVGQLSGPKQVSFGIPLELSEKQSTPALRAAYQLPAGRRRTRMFKAIPRSGSTVSVPRKRRITDNSTADLDSKRTQAPVTPQTAWKQPAQPLSYAKILNATLKCDTVKLEYVKSSPNADFNNALEIPVEVIRLGSIPYENTLYGYFIGRSLPFRQVCYHVEKMWSGNGLQKVTTNGNGYYFFKFDCSQNLNWVLEGGPWIIQNVPIFVKKWEVGLKLSKQQHSSVPLWVKIHQIPCELLTGLGISHLASALGVPLAMDAYTSEMCKGGTTSMKYARVLVEFNAENEWKEYVEVVIPKLNGEGKVIHRLMVEYPWRPTHCKHCRVYGHDNRNCTQGLEANTTTQRADVQLNAQDAVYDGFQQVTRRKTGNKLKEQSTPLTQGHNASDQPRKHIHKPNTSSKTTQNIDASGGTPLEGHNHKQTRMPYRVPVSQASTPTKLPLKITNRKISVKPLRNIKTSTPTRQSNLQTSNNYQLLADLDVIESLEAKDDTNQCTTTPERPNSTGSKGTEAPDACNTMKPGRPVSGNFNLNEEEGDQSPHGGAESTQPPHIINV